MVQFHSRSILGFGTETSEILSTDLAIGRGKTYRQEVPDILLQKMFDISLKKGSTFYPKCLPTSLGKAIMTSWRSKYPVITDICGQRTGFQR